MDAERPSPRAAIAQAVLAGTLAGACALAMASGIPGLGDSDPYRHLAYARALWESHLRLRGHPALPYTLLGHSGVDFWWGFHLLLGPFTLLGTVWGARLAGACIAFVTAASLCLLIRRLGGPLRWTWGVAPVLLSFAFAYRDQLARPAHLTVVLLLVQLAAGVGALPATWAFLAGAVHGWLHLSAPASVVFAGIGWAGAVAASRRVPALASLRPVAGALLGVLVGVTVRPGGLVYHRVALAEIRGDFGGLPHGGWELLPAPWDLVLEDVAPVLLLLLASAWLGRRRERFGTPATRAAALLAVAITGAMCLRAFRFVDYFVPFAVVAAALAWPRILPGSARAHRTGAAAATVLALLSVGLHLRTGWELGGSLFDPPRTYDELAAEVRSRVPPGTLLFTLDPYVASVLYASLPDYRYPVAYDAAMFYLQDPARFWAWHHLGSEVRFCPEPSCPPGAPSGAEAVARTLGLFATDALLSQSAFHARLEAALAGAPALFTAEATVEAPVSGRWTLWRLRRPDQRR